MKLMGAQLYTLRDFMKDVEGVKATFKKVHDIGYKAVQVSGMCAIDADELNKIAKANDLRIVNTHVPLDRMENDLKALVNEHKTYGADIMGIGALPEEYRYSKEGYEKFGLRLEAIAKKLKDYGMGLSYHNHNFEFQRFGEKTALEILADNSENVSFLLDTYWVQYGGGNSADWIYRLKGRIDVIHFKDYETDRDKPSMAEVGKGNLNWDSIFNACEETGVKWHMVEQDTCKTDPFECLKTSYEFLKANGFE